MTDRAPNAPLYFRVSKAPEVIGVSRATVYRWIGEGLPLYKRGGVSLVSVADVRAFIEERMVD